MIDDTSISTYYKGRVFSNDGFPEFINLVRDEDRTILDVGCGAGANARLLRARGKTVHGITLSEDEAKVVSTSLDRVLVGNIETMSLDYPDGYFDAIILSHVLEHLVNPWSVLGRLRKLMRPGGRVYVALPNIGFYQERIKVLLGRFHYAEAGVIERLHLRFFTFNSAQDLIREGGYKIVLAKSIGAVPLWPLRRLINKSTWLDRAGCAVFPNLFGWHIIVVGEKDSSSI